jgi:hypothetical protein
MKHEKDEIAKVKSRLANLSLEDMIPPVSQSSVMPGTYLPEVPETDETEARLPEPPGTETSQVSNETQMMTIPPQVESPAEPESDWIKRMNSQ